MTQPIDTETHRMIVLAARGKTRVMKQGNNGATSVTHEEIVAMAWFCNAFLEDYPGTLTHGEPNLNLVPIPEQEEEN